MLLRTEFSKNLQYDHILQEYPRPLMKRNSYINLNGYWDYAITSKKEFPITYDGKILVPFSPESELSEVKRQLKPDEFLWYHCIINDPRELTDNRVLLQFGAIDQYAEVYINGILLFTHIGGYYPFTIDITASLKPVDNSLIVLVTDSTDTSYLARGKQKLTPGGMFYTSQSGIWQTVFMECVPKDYITTIQLTPDYDNKSIELNVTVSDNSKALPSTFEIYDDGNLIGKKTLSSSLHTMFSLNEVKSWTPELPFLYTAIIKYGDDEIETYFAMRKIDVQKDDKGILRICLNNSPYFQNGLLDQGYWPESLYTAPSDEAMIFDIKTAKELGFNMLRKHAKLEPQRWYYHCDRLGMLVWQDFVNGGTTYHSWFVTYFPTIFSKISNKIKDTSYRLLSRLTLESRNSFYQEMEETVNALYNHPSIILWTVFNEGWGQFDSIKVTEHLRKLDATRLIDSASGWFDQGCGDVRSLHIYFTKMRFRPGSRPLVLSEFGGYTLKIEEHTDNQSTYGYRHYHTAKELEDAIEKVYQQHLIPGKKQGLCAIVYTQLSDIEDEINGLLTYDRKVLKVSKDKLKTINQSFKG